MENEISDLRTKTAVQSRAFEHVESDINWLAEEIKWNRNISASISDRVKSVEIANNGHVAWINSQKVLLGIAVTVLIGIFGSNVYFATDQSAEIEKMQKMLILEKKKSCDLWSVYSSKEFREHSEITIGMKSELDRLNIQISKAREDINKGGKLETYNALVESRDKKSLEVKEAERHGSKLKERQKECG